MHVYISNDMGLRHKKHITLSSAQRDRLLSLISASNPTRNRRIQALFDLDNDVSIKTTAFKNRIGVRTINHLLKNYKVQAENCVLDIYHMGRGRKLTKDVCTKIDELLASPPPGKKRKWSNMMVAKELMSLGMVEHLNQNTVWKYKIRKAKLLLQETENGK